MKMKINKLLLYNFNSFEGENTFDFTSHDEKNIILIGGKNGAGKTSLFMAIKIALYGPLAFGYLGVNPHYIAKIKDCINSKAFQTDKVEAKVQLTISLMIERELKEYTLTREWDYSKQKLVEEFSINEGDKVLNDQEKSYFQNYLKGLIPPDLFEFFLFDGEVVGDIFSTSTYNKYVQNAVYTLCGLDIYEIIRRFTAGYIGKSSNENEEEYVRNYEAIKEKIESCEEKKAEIEHKIRAEEDRLDQIETELSEVETAFKNAGGITAKERKRLAKEFDEAERVKADSAAQIKLFVEGLMPFYLVKDYNSSIKKQIDIEEEMAIYQYIERKLNKDELVTALQNASSKKTIDQMLSLILSQFKPEKEEKNDEPLFGLSREERSRVDGVISTLNTFDTNHMISVIASREKASDKTAEINRVLKNSMDEEDASDYTRRENELLKEKETTNGQLYQNRTQLGEINDELTQLTVERDRAKQNVLNHIQNRHVYELSDGLANMMSTLLSEKTVSIKHDLEELIVSNLKRIYRKNNLITYIEIGDNFQLNLYQDAIYSSAELLHLLKNLGKDEFSLAIGKAGKKKLFSEFKVDTVKELARSLKLNGKDNIQLFKNIDLNRLSKGERQIFILALYWAIIEVSGKDIPFVIDTPYARIDADHREEISKEFFPNISNQVVILSTDEEINERYYKLLKPHISQEYLLVNDESQNKTTVENRYFF